MAFGITITEEADRQFRSLSVRDQRSLKRAIAVRLEHQPTLLSNAIRRLRPNSVAEFELRVGTLRALYNIQTDEVVIIVVGRKVGNKLIVEGEEYHGHQNHPTEPPGNGPPADT